MSKLITLVLLCLACLAWIGGCSKTSSVTPDATDPQPEIEPTQQQNDPNLTHLIGEIINSPGDFSGQRIEIVGYFRGWDLLEEVNGSPPVTRSDWVIADQSGAIYVTGKLPEGLDPASPEDILTVIRLQAMVLAKPNVAYLEAQSVEVVAKP